MSALQKINHSMRHLETINTGDTKPCLAAADVKVSTQSENFVPFLFSFLLVSLGYCLIQLLVTLSKMSLLISSLHYQVWGKHPPSRDSFKKNLFTHTGYTRILLTSLAVIQVMFTRAECTDSPIPFPKNAGAKLGLISHN